MDGDESGLGNERCGGWGGLLVLVMSCEIELVSSEMSSGNELVLLWESELGSMYDGEQPCRGCVLELMQVSPPMPSIYFYHFNIEATLATFVATPIRNSSI
jgi:hypothetical protein